MATVKTGHIEGRNANNLIDLYTDHALAARLAFSQGFRDFSGKNIEVTAIDANAVIVDQATRDIIKKLDVGSISSGFHDFGNMFNGIVSGRNLQTGPENSILFRAGGNINPKDRDIIRSYDTNSLDTSPMMNVVGEAGRDDKGNYFVKAHNRTGNLTFVALNPYDNGLKVKYFNEVADLKPYKNLVEEYIRDKQLSDLLKQNPQFDQLPKDQQRELAQKINDQVNSGKWKKERDQKTEFYLKNPKILSEEIKKLLNDKLGIDDQGYTSKLSGTSFATPYSAGIVAAAVDEEKQKALSGKPALTKQEISQLAMLSCIPLNKKAGEDKPLLYNQNSRGLSFNEEAGFGLFDEKLFKQNLTLARNLLNKGEARSSQVYTLETTGGKINKSGNEITINVDSPEGLISNKISFSFNDIDHVKLVKESAKRIDARGPTATIFPVQIISPSGTRVQVFINADNNSFLSTDKFLGENPKGEWKIITPDAAHPLLKPKMLITASEKGGITDKVLEVKCATQNIALTDKQKTALKEFSIAGARAISQGRDIDNEAMPREKKEAAAAYADFEKSVKQMEKLSVPLNPHELSKIAEAKAPRQMQ